MFAPKTSQMRWSAATGGPVEDVIRKAFPTEKVCVGPYSAIIGHLEYGLPVAAQDFNYGYDQIRYNEASDYKLEAFSFELNISTAYPWRSPYSSSEPNRSDLDD